MHYSHSSRRSINIWPGFVDALAALLMVIVFLLLIFSIGQFYLTGRFNWERKNFSTTR